MRTCIECGAPLSDEDQFCLNCGADVPQPETDNNPYPEENNEPVQEQPVQQEYTQQQPVQQEPIQQEPIQQQPVQQQPAMYPQAAPQQPMPQQPEMYQQTAPQQPMQQQAGMYPPPPGMYPQQPMQQPGMYPQQTMQQQPGMYQQPEQKQGSSNKTLLYVLIPLVVVGAAVAILFATGVFSGKKDAAKSEQTEVAAQVEQSTQVQDQEQPSEEENQPVEQSNQGDQNVTLCGITFPLAKDYEVIDRKKLNDSEACLIVPKGAADRSNRLVLRIYPSMLEGVDGITNEEIGDMLSDIVDNNAGVLANTEKTGFKLDRAYKIHYDDNADGSYFPHCYTYLNWTDRNGKHSRSYTEATLVKRIVTSCSAIATDEGELQAFTDIYSEVVQAANK